MINANKKAFTLLELVIALGLLSLGIVSVIRVMNEGIRFIDRARQDVVAINLAREGVEAVFNIRNTNRRKRSGKRDECRLLQDPFAPSGDCNAGSWIQSGTYRLGTSTFSGQQYFVLSGVTSELLDVTDGISANESQFALCETASGWVSCPGGDNAASEGRFYRQIVGKGLFRKNDATQGGLAITCPTGASSDGSLPCGDDGAKEFRFCVRVGIIKQGTNTVEQCAVLTNFME